MGKFWRGAFTLLFVVSVAIGFSGTPSDAANSIWTGDFERRVTLTAKQKPKVRQILKRAERSLFKALRKVGVDPFDREPDGLKLFRASRELRAIGRRTRSQLSRILNAKQMRTYDQSARKVEARVRRSVRL